MRWLVMNKLLDKLVRHRQEICEHSYQDRVVISHKTFCGKCGLEN